MYGPRSNGDWREREAAHRGTAQPEPGRHRILNAARLTVGEEWFGRRRGYDWLREVLQDAGFDAPQTGREHDWLALQKALAAQGFRKVPKSEARPGDLFIQATGHSGQVCVVCTSTPYNAHGIRHRDPQTPPKDWRPTHGITSERGSVVQVRSLNEYHDTDDAAGNDFWRAPDDDGLRAVPAPVAAKQMEAA
ncbi:hypothetical protein [Euryhalocaulis caribicus]|uniref:hypothetical protein n=1 Tax=Euryhalocaulis caribicus TaxID=1161401 RepID=UPI0003AAB0DB|nr:hypothetical protein [Euryhalocaulis caribicus]